MSYSRVLVGPSNGGKSFWRVKFEDAGYNTVCVDDLIEQRLGPFLMHKGYRGIKDVSRWMGQPYNSRYRENSKLYLSYEREVMYEVMRRLESGEELIIDTTGSVIYTGDVVTQNLMSLARVVAFGIPDRVKGEMLQQYFKRPKPVIWGGNTFSRRRSESGRHALVRCYPKLLDTRLVMYEAMAHKVLSYDLLRLPGFNVETFLALTA